MLVTVLRELRILCIVLGKGDVATYSEIELRIEDVRASIWLARTAGEGGSGTERAMARAREGVRVARAVEMELSLERVTLAFCALGIPYSWFSVHVDALAGRDKTHAVSTSSRDLIVCLCLGFSATPGLCLTGEAGSTPW